MSVTFFNNGLTVSDEAAARADTFCSEAMLNWYRAENGDEDPPGWPSMQAKKLLIEWSIKWLFAHRVRQWEREIAIRNLQDPSPWEGAGLK